jgi:hypothetical protein
MVRCTIAQLRSGQESAIFTRVSNANRRKLLNMKPIRILAAISLLFLAQVACNLITQAPVARTVPTEIPVTAAAAQPTEVPTLAPTPLPLYQTVTLDANTVEENGKGPDYTLKVVTPVLKGSSDPRVEKFNQLAAARVQQAVEPFKNDLVNQPTTPISAGSYFSLTYALISPPGNLLSLQLHIEGYTDGAAHPYHITSSFNYDLEKGQEISLDQFFLPGIDYLKTISNYCTAELSKRDIGFEMFSDGAKPTPENYTVWNVSATGLVITFNEYQVAPYAAGPQEVVIPYSTLKEIINLQGPLSFVVR